MRSTIGGFVAFVAGFLLMLVVATLALLSSGSSALPIAPASPVGTAGTSATQPSGVPPTTGAPTAAPTAGGSAGLAGSTTVHAIEKDFAISLDTSAVKAGSVTFDVRNQGPSPHNLGIVRNNGASRTQGLTNRADLVKDSATIDAGTSTQMTMDLQPGTYQVVCTVPGHIQLGMILSLAVT